MGDAKEYPLPMPIPMPRRPSRPERKKSAIPARFFLDLAESFLFLVWIPSFFMVRGRSTCPEMSLDTGEGGVDTGQDLYAQSIIDDKNQVNFSMLILTAHLY